MKKLCFRRFLPVFLGLILFMVFISVAFSIIVKQGVVFKTSSNNTKFVMGSIFDFYKVEVNSTHLWMDRSYTSRYYTRYCIYVTSPNDVQFTVNTWFATKDSSGKLTIDTPSSTNINLGFHSPNLLTASAIGVVTQTWTPTNKTLNMIANSDTSSTITITVTVTETKEDNIAPENVDIAITDMEGTGSWVFSEESYYTFQAKYWDGNGYDDLDTMKIKFTDGNTWVIAVYDRSANTWSLESGSNIARITSGTVTILGQKTLQVTFPIYFENTILDALDVDIYMYCIDTTNREDGWDLMQSDYFNIYNLGGHSTLTSSGNAGRLAGGDVFDFYGYNSESQQNWVESTVRFRNLQHVKLLPEITATIGGAAFRIDYYIDYCTEEDDWILGWGLSITNYGYYIGSVRSAVWIVEAFGPLDTFIDITDYVYTFHSGVNDQDNTTSRFWIDLWFNRINASSTVGARMNAYYFPMKDSSNQWLRWLTGNNWGIDDAKRKQFMFSANLLDSNGEVIHASEIKMVRIKSKLVIAQSSATQYVTVKDYDVFDLTFGSDPMEGIQTPAFDETKVPVMPQGGFLGWLGSIFAGFINWLRDDIVFGGLNLWQHFINFVDTIFGFFGYPKAFSNFLDILDDFWTWMAVSLGYIASFLTSIFTFLSAVMAKFLNTVSTIVTNWVKIIQGVFDMLDTGKGYATGIWDQLQLGTWVIIIAIFYPIYLLGVWETQGIDAVINQLRFMMDLAAWLIRIFITVIQMAIRLIQAIIESIPVIE